MPLEANKNKAENSRFLTRLNFFGISYCDKWHLLPPSNSRQIPRSHPHDSLLSSLTSKTSLYFPQIPWVNTSLHLPFYHLSPHLHLPSPGRLRKLPSWSRFSSYPSPVNIPTDLTCPFANAIKLLQVTPLENLHGFPVTSSGVQRMRSGSCLPHPDPFGPALPVRACVVGGSSSEACCLPVNTLSSSIPSWIAFL